MPTIGPTGGDRGARDSSAHGDRLRRRRPARRCRAGDARCRDRRDRRDVGRAVRRRPARVGGASGRRPPRWDGVHVPGSPSLDRTGEAPAERDLDGRRCPRLPRGDARAPRGPVGACRSLRMARPLPRTPTWPRRRCRRAPPGRAPGDGDRRPERTGRPRRRPPRRHRLVGAQRQPARPRRGQLVRAGRDRHRRRPAAVGRPRCRRLSDVSQLRARLPHRCDRGQRGHRRPAVSGVARPGHRGLPPSASDRARRSALRL